MSFPKAKLQRFNDVHASTPSPADYNVSTKNHVSGAIIPKSERFVELRSPVSSDQSSFISNGPSTSFKTPNPPRKVKGVSSNYNRKPKYTDLFSADDAEALKEKIVECNNKDLFIQELTEHVEELKQELSDLKKVISQLKEDKSCLESNKEKLNEDHTKTLTELENKYKLETTLLKNKTLEVSEAVDRMKSNFITLKEQSVRDLNSVLASLGVLENLLVLLNKIYQSKLEDDINQIKNVHLLEIDELKRMHQKEIQVLESDMLKTVTNMHNIIDNEKENEEKRVKELEYAKKVEIDDLIKKYNEERLQLTQDFEMKIQQMKENFKEAAILTEIQAREKCEAIELDWKAKVKEVQSEADARLKECQAIAEYNVIQTEIEKNKVVYELSEEKKKVGLLQAENLEIKNNYFTLETKEKSLEIELSNIIVELNNTRQDLGQELEHYKEEVKIATKDKNLYELTVQKTHKTVEALKKRLMKSDRDVEQLKVELEATEESKLEVEGKCNQLMQELDIITDLYEAIEEQTKFAMDTAEHKMLQLKEELLQKIDTFVNKANEEIKLKEKELSTVKADLAEAKELLQGQHVLNTKAQEWILVCQKEINRAEVLEEKVAVIEDKSRNILQENSKLRNVVEFMQASENDFLKQLNDLKNKSSNCKCNLEKTPNNDELNEKYLALLERLKLVEQENSELHVMVKEQNDLIGPFRDHLKAYEIEYSALMNEKQHAEKEAYEMGLKYAEILGHQNQKQKIKHLEDLKKKNIALNEEKQKLELKVRSQARTIENLKSELTTPKKLSKRDKENVDHLNTSISSSRIDSPGPLKERN